MCPSRSLIMDATVSKGDDFINFDETVMFSAILIAMPAEAKPDRRALRRVETRQKLLDSGRLLFSLQGVDATTITVDGDVF